jgi:hypothetical protein
MPKKTWNVFVTAHGRGICVSTGGYVGQEPGGRLTSGGLKLPTSYAILSQTLNQNLKGDWAIRKSGKSIQIVLSTRDDLATVAQLLLSEIGPVERRPLPAPCAEAYQFVYKPSDYSRFAKALGYAP